MTPDEQLTHKLTEITRELDDLRNKHSELEKIHMSTLTDLRLARQTEKLACDMYEKEELRVAQEYQQKMLDLDLEKRRVLDFYRKMGLLEINEDLTPETQAMIESRGLATITDVAILGGLVDLHAALMRQFSEQLRKVASDIEINQDRKRRAIKSKTLAIEERENPKPVGRIPSREEIQQREKLTAESNGDKAYRKALKSLMDTGRSLDDAKKMLEMMGMKQPEKPKL